jgi:hypothetical protein
MPDKIVIEGVPPYDGEYDFDADYMTMRELHIIKQLTGLRVGEFQEALAQADTDVILGLAVIALRRNGKEVNEDALWDAEAGAITYVAEEVEAASPPEQQPEAGDEPSDSRPSSGVASSTPSANPENGQSPTGQPDSAISAISDLATSAS